MKISISAQHFKLTKEIKDYVEEKVEKLDKFHPKITKIDVKLMYKKTHRGKEKDFYCELIIDVPGKNVEILDNESTIEEAIDLAADRAKVALTRHKEKFVSKIHKKAISLKRKFLGS